MADKYGPQIDKIARALAALNKDPDPKTALLVGEARVALNVIEGALYAAQSAAESVRLLMERFPE